MMQGAKRPLHLVLDNLPAHKIAAARGYVDELAQIKANPNLVRSFFNHPIVSYVSDL
nr:hypothetical protein [Cephaloticoccus primus]